MSNDFNANFNPTALTDCGINTQYLDQVIYPLINTNSDNIGSKTDLVQVPYVEGLASVLAFLHTGYYHVHGRSFVYPNHANEVQLTSGVGAWNLTGALTEVIPAGALNTAAFDLHWIEISNIADVSTIQIDIYAGSVGNETLIGAAKATRSTNQSRNGAARVQIPQQVAGSRISCRLSDSTVSNTTVLVSFSGHYYTL